MTKNRESDEISKPTFEACLSSQEEARRFITKHMENNMPLSNSERDKFFLLIASATLGEGANTKFSIFLVNKIYTIKSVESAARWLAEQDSIRVCIPGSFGYPNSPMVDISVFWRSLLDHLFVVFPVSLSKALSMSREDTRSKQSEGYKVS